MCGTEVHFRPQSHQWAPANKLSYVSQGQGLCLAPKLCLCSWSVSIVKWQREAFQCHRHDSTATHMGSIIADSYLCKEYWMFSPFQYISLMHVFVWSAPKTVFLKPCTVFSIYTTALFSNGFQLLHWGQGLLYCDISKRKLNIKFGITMLQLPIMLVSLLYHCILLRIVKGLEKSMQYYIRWSDCQFINPSLLKS